MKETRLRIRAQDRRRQILETAMDLFARNGYEGTTTRRIAERAGVNEAIIFRHFPRKEDLYWTLLAQKCRGKKEREELQIKLRSGGEEREVFAAIAEDILRRNCADTRLGRLLLYSALENHRLSHRFFRTYVADFYETLAAHIRQRIQEGRFRRIDALLAARGFLGMVVYHFLIQELFGGKRLQKFDPKKVSATLADIWVEGMLARNGRIRPMKPSPAR